MKRRSLVATAFVAVLAMSAAGCAAPDGGDGEATEVRVRFSADPTTFDPAIVTAGDDFVSSRLIFDTLVRYDEAGEITAGLATDWETTSTGGTFTIRDDATCADGTEITPTVVADSLTRFVSPDLASSYKQLVFGAGDVSISADDVAGAVTIELSEPFSELLPGLTTTPSGIVCPAGLEDTEGLADGTVEGAFSGPYTLEEARPGVSYSFALRDDYSTWPDFVTELDGTSPDTISFTVGADYSTNANEVLAGSLDVAPVNASDIDRMDNVVTVTRGEQYIVFNEDDGSPFADIELRRAVAGLLSAQAYNDVAYGGESVINYTVGAPTMQCAMQDDSLLVPEDPQDVIASGILDGVSFTFSASNSFGPNGAGAEYVYQQLISAGADVDYVLQDNSTWAGEVLGPDPTLWDLTLFGTVNQTNTLWTSVSRIMGIPIEDGGRSMTRADNPEGLELSAEVLAADDEEAKCEAYAELQANFLGRVDVVPLVSSATFTATSENVAYFAPNGREDFTTIRVLD